MSLPLFAAIVLKILSPKNKNQRDNINKPKKTNKMWIYFRESCVTNWMFKKKKKNIYI